MCIFAKVKSIISILFLGAILFQNCSSVFILANFYINRADISQNLCVNRFDKVKLCKGKCYLEKDLKQNEKQQEKFPDLKLKEINLYCPSVSLENYFSDNTLLLLSKVFKVEMNHYSSTHLTSIFHPPRVA